MGHPTRRSILLSMAILGTGGCIGPSGNGSGPADTGGAPTDDSDNDGTPSQQSSEGDSTVHAGYETTEVSVIGSDDSVLGSVTAAIADTRRLRITGLSNTDHLPYDRGMLFVFDSVGRRTFVMRGMDFGIDIVFADADGVITTIHHAPKPGFGEIGSTHRYPGRGQYVLEVNYEWTADHGVTPGDRLKFES